MYHSKFVPNFPWDSNFYLKNGMEYLNIFKQYLDDNTFENVNKLIRLECSADFIPIILCLYKRQFQSKQHFINYVHKICHQTAYIFKYRNYKVGTTDLKKWELFGNIS